jgi:ABC-type transporter Mla subunit MlaD
MVQETLSQIENRVRESSAISEHHRVELLKLIGQLRTEISGLAKTHADHAGRIVDLAQVSAQAATDSAKNPAHLRHSLDGLESSVRDFEKTHPQLAAVVNRISGMLSNMGI